MCGKSEIVICGEKLDDVPRDGVIEVAITAPGDANRIIPTGPFKGRQLSVSAVTVRE